MTRTIAFISAILSCLCAGSIGAFSLYGHLFQRTLHYTQLQVNSVAIAAELAMYLPVPIFGYACDRVGPAPLSFIAAWLFGGGYALAAFTYRSGEVAGRSVGLEQERGWPLGVMVAAFVAVGMGTSAMYLSAVTTCAKNFGRGRFRGLALAVPIAMFGLSSMWQSQVGSRILYVRRPDGSRGDVDVFKFFIFLAVVLLLVGLLGTMLLKIVDEEEMIDDAVEELERSGLLEDSAFFQRGARETGYGTLGQQGRPHSAVDSGGLDTEDTKSLEDEEARKKTWLLNEETRRFLKDHTMWWLAAGFFFVTGPGEAFINNLGTIIGTLYPPSTDPSLIPTSPATHVSIVAITSTIARILTGTITDILAPISTSHHYHTHTSSSPPRPRFTVSRIIFLLTFSLILSIGLLLLASGAIQNHAEHFWLVSALIGSGYGAVFSLTPIIITVIWGVENFGTNWGIVAMVPALGATVWGVVYSWMYQYAAGKQSFEDGMGEEKRDLLCYGKECYAGTFWAMTVSVWVACGLWLWAWKGPGGWSKRGIAV